MSLNNKTYFITGASRGIGLEIACKLAAQGANLAIAAKTVDPNPKLPGTLSSAAQAIEAAGGRCLPIQCDIRDEEALKLAVDRAADHFGGIDGVINNASAIFLMPTELTPMKRFDLMFGVNVRGTFATTQAALPHLKASAKAGRNPHVLNLSPPLNMNPAWFGPHVAYTMAKYGMSMCVLGMAGEFKGRVAFNALWPRTAIATAAVEFALGGDQMMRHSRTPEIVADAAAVVFGKDAKTFTGNFLIDDEVLAAEGITDLEKYKVTPGMKDEELVRDFFV